MSERDLFADLRITKSAQATTISRAATTRKLMIARRKDPLDAIMFSDVACASPETTKVCIMPKLALAAKTAITNNPIPPIMAAVRGVGPVNCVLIF